MDQLQAQRRLVKSPPELWAEVSNEDVLRHHLAPFGAIRITRVDPESTVAWEGERASGTVSLDAAGWGTRVTLTAVPVTPEHGEREPWVDPRRWLAPEDEPWSASVAPEAAQEPSADEPEPEPEDDAEVEVEAAAEPAPVAVETAPPRRGWLARLFGRDRPEAEITPPAPPAPAPAPPVPRPDPAPQPPAHPPAPPDPAPPPVEPPAPGPDPSPPSIEASELPVGEALRVLEGMLDHLGAAHHRPFSRG